MNWIDPLSPIRQGWLARAHVIPPPIGGLNDRDALDIMQPQDAIKLVNWWPRTHDVVMRNGYEEYADTGETTEIKWCAEFRSASAKKHLCSTNNKVFDITNPASVSNITAGSPTSSAWKSANFDNKLWMVNGADGIFVYDGTTLADDDANWTDEQATFFDVMSFKNRLYFLDANSSEFYYSDTNIATKTLSSVDLAYIGITGGAIVGMAALTKDGGDGNDDVICFFMEGGEVIVYSGSDPGSDFTLIGVFRMGRLIDANGVLKLGSDVVAITTDGYVPLTRVLPFGRSRQQGATLSDKIIGTAVSAVENNGSQTGWCFCFYPRRRMLLVNVPQSSSTFHQHAMNLDTGAWTTFEGMNSRCWCVYDDDLYFGGTNGKVYKADTGADDDGGNINVECRMAWNYLGLRTNTKRVTGIRPIIQVNANVDVDIRMNADFHEEDTGFGYNASIDTGGSQWSNGNKSGSSYTKVQNAKWSLGNKTGSGYAQTQNATWAQLGDVLHEWQSGSNMGYVFSFLFKAGLKDDTLRWMSTNVTFEPGGLI